MAKKAPQEQKPWERKQKIQINPETKNMVLSIIMLVAAAVMLIWLGVQIWKTNAIDDVPESTPLVEITPEPTEEATIIPEAEDEIIIGDTVEEAPEISEYEEAETFEFE